MKVWTCIDHDGHYPVGVASVVVAETEAAARELLKGKLVEHGLDPDKPFELVPLPLTEPRCRVLQDGDY